MNKIIFRIEGGEDVSIFAADGENLLSLARKSNIAIDAPCSGNGSCGKCRVRLLTGSLDGEPSRHISAEESAQSWRLACASSVNGDAVLLIPETAFSYQNHIKTTSISSDIETAVYYSLIHSLEAAGMAQGGSIRSVNIRLNPPTLDDTMPDNERLSRSVSSVLGVECVSLPYSVLQTMPEFLRDNDFDVCCVARITVDSAEILDLLPGGEEKAYVCGLAVDIGTTTVSGLLVDMETGEILATANAGNGQIRYGADVINRIIEQRKPGGVAGLQKAIITDTLLPMISDMCAVAGIPLSRIYQMTVASNTTMNHLLLGINANFLRTEPYIPAFFELEPFDPSQLGVILAPTAKMGVAPNIGSYVGGDITAGTLASMIWDSPELSVLIDLGTNGEIVFGNNEFLMSCACSAGPAFEGGDISCGMRAADGAIEACIIDAATMEPSITVIGGGKPVGLCGSGLIDAVAGLFRAGIINGKGKFKREGERIRRDNYGIGSYIIAFARDSAINRDIVITETDLDNFIRAKGAVFSAIVSLTKPLGFTLDDIGRVIVAGGIGSGINIKNAVCIGMLPDLSEDRFSYIGNSSLTGAYAMLVSSGAGEFLRELAKSMTYIELSTQPGYMDAFIAACFLPHTDETLFPSIKSEER